MSERERRTQHEEPVRTAGDPSGEPGAGLAAQRAQAEKLLAAGAEAIDRALSSDSEAFLRASRQAGGQ